MKRSHRTAVEVAEVLAGVGVQIVHLQPDVKNVLKLSLELNVKIKTIAQTARNDQIAHKITKTLSRLFVKKTKKLNSSYLNLSTTSSEQWVS